MPVDESGYIRLPRAATTSATACTRVLAPSFVVALRTWVRTVSGERNRFEAIA